MHHQMLPMLVEVQSIYAHLFFSFDRKKKILIGPKKGATKYIDCIQSKPRGKAKKYKVLRKKVSSQGPQQINKIHHG